jgi:hypothetical protein
LRWRVHPGREPRFALGYLPEERASRTMWFKYSPVHLFTDSARSISIILSRSARRRSGPPKRTRTNAHTRCSVSPPGTASCGCTRRRPTASRTCSKSTSGNAELTDPKIGAADQNKGEACLSNRCRGDPSPMPRGLGKSARSRFEVDLASTSPTSPYPTIAVPVPATTSW